MRPKSLATAPSTPLTKAYSSSLAYCLVSSTASLMVTPAGISVRYFSSYTAMRRTERKRETGERASSFSALAQSGRRSPACARPFLGKIQCEAVHLQIPGLCCPFDDLIDILVGKCFSKADRTRPVWPDVVLCSCFVLSGFMPEAQNLVYAFFKQLLSLTGANAVTLQRLQARSAGKRCPQHARLPWKR